MNDLPKVTIENPKYPIKDYKKMTFNFSKAEQMKFVSLDTVEQLGNLANMLKNTILNNVILPRVGIKTSSDLGVEYDTTNGTFFVYVPRDICSKCQTNKAVYSKENKKYCEKCFSVK